MRLSQIGVAVLFSALVAVAVPCHTQVNGYLTAQEEAACTSEFKIRQIPDNSDISQRGFASACSLAMLGKQEAEFAALRWSIHSRRGQKAAAYEKHGARQPLFFGRK